jgi:hypothetical protein
MQFDSDHATLLEEWKSKYPGREFVYDGIIDYERWDKTPCRTLFILKESYHSKDDSGDWDMRKDLREYGKPFGQTFTKTAYLAYLINQLAKGENPNFSNIETNNQILNEAFLSSAIVNVKKPVGYPKSNSLDLIQYVTNDAGLLLRQIELIDPKFIVCGGTWYILQEVDVFPNCKKISDRVFSSNNMFIFDIWHPAVPAPGEMIFNAFAWIAERSGVFKTIL